MTNVDIPRFTDFKASQPEKFKELMQELADGNTDIDLTHAARGDEIGSIFQTLETFRDNIEATKKLEAEAEEQRVQQAKREEEDRKAEEQRREEERLHALKTG